MENNIMVNNLEIECSDEMERLITILTKNGYVVQVEPVYETLDDLKKKYPEARYTVTPGIKYWSVKIINNIGRRELVKLKEVH